MEGFGLWITSKGDIKLNKNGSKKEYDATDYLEASY